MHFPADVMLSDGVTVWLLKSKAAELYFVIQENKIQKMLLPDWREDIKSFAKTLKTDKYDIFATYFGNSAGYSPAPVPAAL